jgi:hypothetical protein
LEATAVTRRASASGAATRRRRRSGGGAPLGTPDLAKLVAQNGATLLGAWVASQAVRNPSQVVSAFRPSYGRVMLPAVGGPIYNPATKSIALDATKEQALLVDASAFNVLTDSLAVAVVCTKPTNAVDQPYLAVVAEGTGTALMVLGARNTAELDIFVTGVSGTLSVLDLTAMSARQALIGIRRREGADQKTYLQRARNAPNIFTVVGATATTGVASRLRIGTNRDTTPPSTRFLSVAELSAVLLFDIADGTAALTGFMTAVNDWCETYAGAVP